MVKFRNFMPFMPFFGMLFMATFPAGLNLYWCTLSSTNLIFFWLYSNKNFLKFIGVPNYYPNTKLAEELSKDTKEIQISEEFKGKKLKIGNRKIKYVKTK